MKMLKQNKGKDIHKIPKSKLIDGPYYVSKKYDGHYTQIVYDGETVTMWTSGGKRFHLANLGKFIKDNFSGKAFHIECEYLYNCEGKLGDRGNSAKLTTYRTEYAKNILSGGDPRKDKFIVLDILDMPDATFDERECKMVLKFLGKDWFELPLQYRCQNLLEAQLKADEFVGEGYEGAMCKSPDHIYQPGKRTNDIIKLKPRLTADLLCIDWQEGTGKYEGMIGSLLLVSNDDTQVWVGSGLTDSQRTHIPDVFVGEVIEIEYEQLQDTYLQPIFKRIRDDKMASEID